MKIRAKYIGKTIKHYLQGRMYIIDLKDGIYSKLIIKRVDLSSLTPNVILQYQTFQELVQNWENISVLELKTVKTCRICNKSKAIDNFSSCAKNKDGLNGTCILCERKRCRKLMKNHYKNSRLKTLLV